ncbi:hypothetical protein PYCCODRAFT_1367093 [Trametes coccinea BRFM310]|uniref:RING-type domain-containing protein n=1 Tax=Trametes coccinea (strain BRFM310) TaxID=1353009 RepID=A0A1Y2INN6_TRAC3|nr:hypothetical protein PYCCODRAFT_1367093 [Trametes coccinea BRFM310]
MPSYYVDNSSCYCSLCDRYFPDAMARTQHIHFARNHPKCEKCNVRFANGNSLRVHYTVSRRHHYCSACDRHFRSPAGLRAHVELSAIHGGGDDSDDSDDDDPIDDSYEGWEDDVGEVRYPDENDGDEPPVSEDEEIAPHEEYWSEDDEPDPFESDSDSFEDVAYSGYAPVPEEFRREEGSVRSGLVEAGAEAGGTSEWCEQPDSSAERPHEGPPPGALTLTCPVCLEAPSVPTATACGHVFCSSCVLRSLHVERQCPVCRKAARFKDLRKLFLNIVT